MNATIPTLLIVATVATGAASQAQKANQPRERVASSRVPVDVSLQGLGDVSGLALGDAARGGSAFATPSVGSVSPLAFSCAPSIRDQAAGGCLMASSIPTPGLLFPPPHDGGKFNVASGALSFVGGGAGNTATGDFATVAGGGGDGLGNTASADFATVGGGASNTASQKGATVAGGRDNNASDADYTTVGGGLGNTASGDQATVGGGSSNTASGIRTTVAGGFGNSASADYATVGGGGIVNIASGRFSTIGDGGNNISSSLASTVGGGISNDACGYAATTRQIDEHCLLRLELSGDLACVRDSVGRLQRWQNPFQPTESLERLERLRIRHVAVLCSTQIVEPRVLGSDRRVVETGRNRVCRFDVAVGILQHKATGALKNAHCPGRKAGGMQAWRQRFAPGLDTDQSHGGVVHKAVKDAKRVASTADARHDHVWHPPGELDELLSCLATNHRLELTHHERVGMWAQHRAEQVVGVIDVRHPVAHRLVDRILQRAASSIDSRDRRPQQVHTKHVEGLSAHVFGPHVDDALQTEQRARRRRRDPMLTSARFRDDSGLAHPDRQQGLAQRVVDLVGPGMREVFPFEEQPRTADIRRKPLRLPHRCRSAHILG